MPVVAIIANGEEIYPDRLREILNDVDITIAADGGAVICDRSGFAPDFIIGDLDSCPPELAAAVPRDHLLRQKDQYSTDLEKALSLARSLAPGKVKILCALGKRSDHAVANMLFFQSWSERLELEIFDNFGRMQILSPGKHRFRFSEGSLISLFSMQPLKNLSLSGFKYNLSQQSYENSFVGISNVATEDVCRIEFQAGRLFLYEVRDAN